MAIGKSDQPHAHFDDDPGNGHRAIRVEMNDSVIHWLTRAESVDLAWSLQDAISDWDLAHLDAETSCGLTK